MTQYQVEAILLAVRNWGEADRMVTLFSKEFGKITAIAYGARRPKNRLAGALQPFAIVDVALASAKSTASVRQCEVKHSFRELREDLTYMAYAMFITEIVTDLWPERQPEPALFELVPAAFSLLTQQNPRIVTLACIWQLLAIAGFCPEYKHCLKCGQAIVYPAFFDIEGGGSVCAGCGSGSRLRKISDPGGLFLERLLTLDWHNPGQFTVRGSALIEIEEILAAFLVLRLERPLKSLSFINLLNTTIPDKTAIKGEQ
jgi:DNA repair protein RecO (recombination protein O)